MKAGSGAGPVFLFLYFMLSIVYGAQANANREVQTGAQIRLQRIGLAGLGNIVIVFEFKVDSKALRPGRNEERRPAESSRGDKKVSRSIEAAVQVRSTEGEGGAGEDRKA